MATQPEQSEFQEDFTHIAKQLGVTQQAQQTALQEMQRDSFWHQEEQAPPPPPSTPKEQEKSTLVGAVKFDQILIKQLDQHALDEKAALEKTELANSLARIQELNERAQALLLAYHKNNQIRREDVAKLNFDVKKLTQDFPDFAEWFKERYEAERIEKLMNVAATEQDPQQLMALANAIGDLGSELGTLVKEHPALQSTVEKCVKPKDGQSLDQYFKNTEKASIEVSKQAKELEKKSPNNDTEKEAATASTNRTPTPAPTSQTR